jgi:chromosome segregation ATPase
VDILKMTTTTDIEKKNLEAHVELCAERYKSLDSKLDSVDRRVTQVEKKLDMKMHVVETVLDEIKSMIVSIQQKRNNQIISWGVGIITTLLSIIGFLAWQVITKIQ